mgnify:CR=1 FL=1|tara:strand:- start:176 stop:757 length:582 start_codon:yes stop_codon:yes gene_type:complete
MSSIKLKHSGGNSVIIAAPSSNPASDRTITLPSNADGTMLTTTNPKAGNIIQVVQQEFTGSFQTASTSFVDITSASVTITPTHANNKILVMVNLDSDYVAGTNALRVIYTQLLRDSTLVDKKAYYLGHGTSSNGYSYYGTPIDMLELDSPNTTSAITYKVQGKTDSGSDNAYFRVNMVSGQCASRLIAMEVAG